MGRLLAIDIGGTHAACALVVDGHILRREDLAVRGTPTLLDLLPRLEAALADIRSGVGVEGLTIAFPALIEPQSNRILSAPAGKYEDAVGFDFDAWGSARLGLPVRLELDGRMALLGERHAGALRGEDDAVLLALGTGIGSAAIMGGNLVSGRSGQASVLGGHFSLDADGPPCICGSVGCIEAYASTWALPRLIEALPLRTALREVRTPQLRDVFDLARAGDQGARTIRDHCLKMWSTAALNLVHAYDAAVVLVTGGAAGAPEVVPFIRQHVHRNAWSPGAAPTVIHGTLGSDAPLLGAEPLWEQIYERI